MSMARVVVEGRNISMRFDGVLALDRVNFRLHERELRCLIGPNGAGKSTFFKCLAGLHTPTSGQMRIGRQQTTRWLPHQIAALGVGIKMQVPSVMDGLSAYENVWLAARRYCDIDQAHARVEAALRQVNVFDLRHRLVGELAHGKRQWVEFVAVLLHVDVGNDVAR